MISRFVPVVCLSTALVGCGPADTSPASPSRQGRETRAPQSTSVEDIAIRFARAALSGDRDAAKSLTLTYGELQVMLTHPPDEASFNAEVEKFLDKLAKEGAEHSAASFKIAGARVVESKTLPAGGKRKIDIKYAAVAIEVEEEGRSHDAALPFMFFETDAGWKFSPKK